MEYSSEDVRNCFDENFDLIEKQDKQSKKTKICLLYATCIIAFLFMFTGMILSYMNYEKVKTSQNNNVKEIKNVIVQEY